MLGEIMWKEKVVWKLDLKRKQYRPTHNIQSIPILHWGNSETWEGLLLRRTKKEYVVSRSSIIYWVITKVKQFFCGNL